MISRSVTLFASASVVAALVSSGSAFAQSGLDSGELTAEAALEVAERQIAQGQDREAAQSILNALAAYESQAEAPQPARLIEAYLALGDVYRRERAHELAFGAYFEAQGVSRRAFGLYNLDQVDIVRRMADSAEAAGSFEEAIALHREAIGLVRRAHGARSVEAVDATVLLADWLGEHEYAGHAAGQYYRASRLLRSIPGHDPLEVVQLLRKSSELSLVASAYAIGSRLGPPSRLTAALDIVQPGLVAGQQELIVRREVSGGFDTGDFPPPNGCVDFKPEIVHESPTDQPLLVAEIVRDIGDWCVALGIAQRYEDAHLLAWDLLAQVENGAQIRQEWFAAPTAVYMPPLRSRVLSDEEDAPIGHVELQFTVDEDGTPRRIEVVAADPEGLLDREARRHIRNSKFRPRIEDGRFASARTAMVLEFRYDPDRAP